MMGSANDRKLEAFAKPSENKPGREDHDQSTARHVRVLSSLFQQLNLTGGARDAPGFSFQRQISSYIYLVRYDYNEYRTPDEVPVSTYEPNTRVTHARAYWYNTRYLGYLIPGEIPFKYDDTYIHTYIHTYIRTVNIGAVNNTWMYHVLNLRGNREAPHTYSCFILKKKAGHVRLRVVMAT